MSYSEAGIPQFDVVFGRNLMAEAVNFAHSPFLVVTMEDLWPRLRDSFPPGCEAYFVRSLERKDLEAALPRVRRYESIIGAGGGQAIDCAKYFSWRTRLPLFQYPTSLSVDAVFGHRAGVRDGGRVRYVGFAVPESVYIDYGVIERAPAMINRAGIGDVLCFYHRSHGLALCRPAGPLRGALALRRVPRTDLAREGRCRALGARRCARSHAQRD